MGGYNGTGKTVISNNNAGLGGGIILRESELVIRSPVIISHNKVQMFGGGIYAHQSTVKFEAKQIIIIHNFAGHGRGGVFAAASLITLTHSTVIQSNSAQVSGGGIYLQGNSKIYLIKFKWWLITVTATLNLEKNSAIYGGGIFVEDNSTIGGLQCQGLEFINSNSIIVKPECFIQHITLYSPNLRQNNLINIFIFDNTAVYGSALYGGLLDRCTIKTIAQSHNKVGDGLEYFNKTTKLSDDATITSDPVKIAFCGNYSEPNIKKPKGDAFKISIAAIDQVGNPVNATIYSSVVTESGVGRLKEGQDKQRVGNQCTELEYNVFSQDSSAQVELYADGPCLNMGISKQTFTVTFLPCTCPIGLQTSQSQISCECVCDKKLQTHHITNCSQKAGTIQLETNIWIGVANSSSET